MNPTPSPDDHRPDQWLVRTAQNLVHGPYQKTEICDFIQSGKLTTLDEVCQASHYWFFLHEVFEVRGQLGVNPPLPARNPEDEVTETEVRTSTKIEAAHPSLSDPAESEITPTPRPVMEKHHQESEASLALRTAIQRTEKLDDASPNAVPWISKWENFSFWKVLTMFLVAVAVVLFLSILRLIRHP